MKVIAGLLALSCMAGCLAEIPPVYNPTAPIITPAGKQGYVVWCSEETDCYQWAGYRCQSGYTVLSDSNHTNSSFSLGWNRFGGGASRSEHRRENMMIECNTPPPPLVHNPPRVIFHEDANGNITSEQLE